MITYLLYTEYVRKARDMDENTYLDYLQLQEDTYWMHQLYEDGQPVRADDDGDYDYDN